MSIATTAQPTARTETKPARSRRPIARLLLIIAGRSYRFWPREFDPGLMSEERHILQATNGRRFSVYEPDTDFMEAMPYLLEGKSQPRRYHCEACDSGDCRHIDALIEIGMF